MKQYLLLTSALVLLSGVAEAACIQTPTCGAMGYDSTVACEGGIKCPFGNAWNCTLANEIAQLKITIEKLEQTAQQEALAKCKIGDILYHDMSCNTNVVASKTPIGIIFDVTNGLAIALTEFSNINWAKYNNGDDIDIPGIQNYANSSTSAADWQGFKNTKAIFEYKQSNGGSFPAAEKVLAYSTEGTSPGQWYLPAAGEVQAFLSNFKTLNTTLSKIGGTQISVNTRWTSTERDSDEAFYASINTDTPSLGSRDKDTAFVVRPVINFISKDKINIDAEIPCEVGSVLYSDKKCHLIGVSDKTPIGVVLDAEKRLAIALESSPSKMQWGDSRTDIPGITNITDESKAKQDFNGKANTAAIKAYNSSLSNYPAAKYAYEYKTDGTNAGDWYLPSMGELYEMKRNQTELETTLVALGKTDFPLGNYWSSSEYSYYIAWSHDWGSNNTNALNKLNSGYVRPVLAF